MSTLITLAILLFGALVAILIALIGFYAYTAYVDWRIGRENQTAIDKRVDRMRAKGF